jgi:hypothetical protein
MQSGAAPAINGAARAADLSGKVYFSSTRVLNFHQIHCAFVIFILFFSSQDFHILFGLKVEK